MNSGKQFEKDIKDSIPQDIYYHRIKDPAQSFSGQGTRFSLHNEFDAYMYKNPYLVAMELKSNQGTSISFSLEDNKHNIKKCQIDSLVDCTKYGIISGIILNFRKTERTYWIDIRDFMEFVRSTKKKSINEFDIMGFNGLLLSQQKKKIHFKYDLTPIFSWKARCET